MKMTSTCMFTLVAILAGCTGIQATTVNCLVAPCSTDACIKKCADFQTKTHKSVTCVDNYNDGCNCDCKVNSGSYTNGTVNCFVAPCTTPECISKCAAFQTYNKNVTCVDNYIGGCNCDCCVAKNAICSVDRKDPPCCGGRICAFTNDCIVNPFTKCGTICVKPADAVENCKKEKCSCDLSKKTPCCKGLTCLKYGSEGRCSKCRGYTKSCSSSRPCCPYLKCKKDSYTGKKTCQPAGLP